MLTAAEERSFTDRANGFEAEESVPADPVDEIDGIGAFIFAIIS
jgi:hypothetical protein